MDFEIAIQTFQTPADKIPLDTRRIQGDLPSYLEKLHGLYISYVDEFDYYLCKKKPDNLKDSYHWTYESITEDIREYAKYSRVYKPIEYARLILERSRIASKITTELLMTEGEKNPSIYYLNPAGEYFCVKGHNKKRSSGLINKTRGPAFVFGHTTNLPGILMKNNHDIFNVLKSFNLQITPSIQIVIGLNHSLFSDVVIHVIEENTEINPRDNWWYFLQTLKWNKIANHYSCIFNQSLYGIDKNKFVTVKKPLVKLNHDHQSFFANIYSTLPVTISSDYLIHNSFWYIDAKPISKGFVKLKDGHEFTITYNQKGVEREIFPPYDLFNYLA